MIIGFGKTELETATEIINECFDAIQGTEQKKEGIALMSIQSKYSTQEKEYSAMDRHDAPERYSYFWANYHEIYAKKYIIEFSFHHINRQHVLSPDGWGMLQTEWILAYNEIDGKRIFKQA